MFRKLGKRGMEDKIYFMLFEIVAIALIVIALFSYVNSVAEDSAYWKNFFVRDSALLIDIIHGAQGSAVVDYQVGGVARTNFPLEFEFLKDRVNIYEILESGRERLPTRAYFGVDTKISVEENTFRPAAYLVTKQADIIRITQSSVIDEQICEGISTVEDMKSKKIFFLPQTQNQDIINNIYLGVQSYLKEETNFTNTISDADMILAFSFNQDNNNNNLTIYYPENGVSQKSKKLACVMLNKLKNIQELPQNYFSGSSTLSSSDSAIIDSTILQKDKLAVFIYFGSAQNYDSIKNQQNRIAEAIGNSIKDYYK